MKLSATGTGGFYLTRTDGLIAVPQLDHFFFAEKVCLDVTDSIPVRCLNNGSNHGSLAAANRGVAEYELSE
ncbi:hypothetical protein EHD48_004049 [Escherichia coli]|nr:hypothetical protein [Escherichia coli]